MPRNHIKATIVGDDRITWPRNVYNICDYSPSNHRNTNNLEYRFISKL